MTEDIPPPPGVVAMIDQDMAAFVTEGQLMGARSAAHYKEVLRRTRSRAIALSITIAWLGSPGEEGID